MTSDHPVARLNEFAIKMGFKPEYQLLLSAVSGHMNEFAISVTCPVSHGGPVMTETGRGTSKKIAKYNAAQAFLNNCLGHRLHNAMPFTDGTPITDGTNTCDAYSNLLLLCNKNNLGVPEFTELCAAESRRSSLFKVECRVSYLSTEGQGRTREEAKQQAATKMIQVLMQKAGIYEEGSIFSQMPPLENSNKIVKLANNLEGLKLHCLTDAVGRKTSVTNSVHTLAPSTISSADIYIISEAMKIIKNMHRSSHNPIVQQCMSLLHESMVNENLTIFGDNCKSGKTMKIAKSKSVIKSFNNDDSESKNSSTDTFGDNQVVRKIKETLQHVEEELHSNILANVMDRGETYKKTIIILCNKYHVLITKNSEVKVIKGEDECCDQSIRIACLVKLLTELMEYVKTKVIDKGEETSVEITQ